MNFESTVTHTSQAIPGVTFTVRRLNSIERAKRDMGMIEASARYGHLFTEARAIDPDYGKPQADRTAELTLDMNRQLAPIGQRMQELIDTAFKPAYLRAGFVSIDGFTIDGQAPDAEKLIACCPDELLSEIFGACSEASGLTEQQQKN